MNSTPFTACKAITDCHECAVGVSTDPDRCAFVARKRDAGQLLYLEGDPATHLWFVKRGTVVLFRDSGENRGEGRVRAVRFPGTFIGLESIVYPQYMDSARASTEVEICGVDRKGADTWLGKQGTPARTALEISVRTTCGDIVRRAAPDGTARQRVAAWLHQEGPRGSEVGLPRHIVADLLGMRPETLSRALAALARCGAISLTRTTLQVIDEERLQRVADNGARA